MSKRLYSIVTYDTREYKSNSTEAFIYPSNNLFNMAKPIRATPTLRGEDAERFVKQMIKKETSAISKADKALYADAEKNKHYFESFLN